MNAFRKIAALLLALLMLASLLAGCTAEQAGRALQTAADLAELLEDEASPPPESAGDALDEDGVYTSKEDLALYLHLYGHLPANFITKDEARRLLTSIAEGTWFEEDLTVHDLTEKYGSGNRECLLPAAKGRVWTECDVNTLGASSRGAERIVFSNDGLIYYTGDHYESFQQLY